MSFGSLFVFFVGMYLVWFFVNEYNPIEKDMDWASYLFAKTGKWYLSNPYPHNTSSGLSSSRSLYDMSLIYPTKFVVARSPELQKIEAGTIDVQIPVEFDGTITARIYNGHAPSEASNADLKPVLVWYHGGGMIIGSMEGAQGNCLKFANHTGYLIVNVDYRLAPEFVFPTPLNDAYTAFLWVEENIAKYGGDPKRLTIGGDSAGGYLTTTVSARYIAAQIESEKKKLNCHEAETCPSITKLPDSGLVGILDVYPAVNATSDSEGAKLYAKTSGLLPLEEVEWMRSLYQGSPVKDMTVRNHYWFSPFNTPSEILSFFPPTIFVFARYDVLTQEGLEFMEKLKKLGVKTEMLWYGSTIHAFFGNDFIPAGNQAVYESSELLVKLVSKK